jgi:hypothetical protein
MQRAKTSTAKQQNRYRYKVSVLLFCLSKVFAFWKKVFRQQIKILRFLEEIPRFSVEKIPPEGVTNRRGLATLVIVIVVLCVFVEPLPVVPVLA